MPLLQTLAMPALSPTMSQGNIAAWQVKEGQEISPGSILAGTKKHGHLYLTQMLLLLADKVKIPDIYCCCSTDIETDKATMEWENQDDGFIAKILKPDGEGSLEAPELDGGALHA